MAGLRSSSTSTMSRTPNSSSSSSSPTSPTTTTTTTTTTTNTQQQPRSSSSPPTLGRQVSIGQRMALSFFITIFGLIFFYLIMVFLSSISTGLTLERFEPHGWARSASRFTALTTLPVLILFLLTPGSTRWSLALAILSACAHFCHFVIISSDLSIYVDDQMNNRIFRTDAHLHPVVSLLPMYFMHAVGTIGFVMFLVITSERCFGNALRFRKKTLPKVSMWAATWIVGVFSIWLIEMAVKVWGLGSWINHNVDAEKELMMLKSLMIRDKITPLVCAVSLWLATYVMWRRSEVEKAEQASIGKQKKAD